jgi:predicted ATPase
MAYSGAVIYELDDDGAHRVQYGEIESVSLWRNFLDSPDRFRHLFDAEP